jgi:hypothetical protein
MLLLHSGGNNGHPLLPKWQQNAAPQHNAATAQWRQQWARIVAELATDLPYFRHISKAM